MRDTLSAAWKPVILVFAGVIGLPSVAGCVTFTTSQGLPSSLAGDDGGRTRSGDAALVDDGAAGTIPAMVLGWGVGAVAGFFGALIAVCNLAQHVSTSTR